MEILIKNNCRIITPLSPKLSELETSRLNDELSNSTESQTGLDMTYVNDCTIDFIETIKKYDNLSLFNINSDIFAILISMNLDKTVGLFVSELDFLNNKHRLLNRKFSIV